MASAPIFAATPKAGSVGISSADASRTAPAAAGTVYAAGASGSRIERVQIVATATTTAGMVRLFVFDGAAYHLIAEVLVSAITPSGTVAAFAANVDFSSPSQVLVLQSGWSLRATTNNAEAFQVTAFGGDF